ncbi:ATP-binding domain-containing protein [Archangium sp. Cb G35]|uniref:ATP-binding domain-containing protein n=1 Tax=Archangium sp. Cb G35 TaxID=1920190 RepID=UPI000936D62C|nr:ATP-binding domain-containing protein [Archangium sp. Cb G35]
MADDTWWLDLNDLDDEQKAIIKLPLNGKHLLLGPPGSGKTNLVLLRASDFVGSKRPNVIVLIFTKELQSFIQRGSKNYNVADEKILTIMKWSLGLLREHGVRTDDLPGDFEPRRLEIASRLHALFDRKPKLEHHLECILVDEVQDCLKPEIDLFFRAARHVFFAGDSRQQIYRTDDIVDYVKSRVDETLALTHHYRSGHEVCKAADVIGKNFGEEPILPTSNYKESKAKSDVKFVPCDAEDHQADEVIKRLEIQVRTYPGELLGVISPRNEDAARIRAAIAASSLAPNLIDEGGLASDDDKTIHVCNMFDAKGLEYRAVHITHGHNVHRLKEKQKRTVYTSVTRAKTSLTVYYIKRIPAYLEEARDEAGPKMRADARSLFPGRKK